MLFSIVMLLSDVAGY